MITEPKPRNPDWIIFIDRIMDTVDMVLSQFTSGRWLLTISAGVCLVHFAWVLPPDKLDKIIDLIKDIVIFYFVVREATDKTDKKQTVVNSIDTTDKTLSISKGDNEKPIV